ncbi:MAG: erythromycin esterase family protein [Gemmatimonadaceae bacterium]|nr:erythromycin esterase family protein [Gemmatimonadaceae bacterium]
MAQQTFSRLWRGASPDAALIGEIQSLARPLRTPADLDPLLDSIGDARYVLLGEATHGTSEFYTWRTEISRRLITEKGFSFIAVEGDWPDCYTVNRYVKGLTGGSAENVLHAFARWPTWMWANREVAELAEWMCDHNARLPAERQAGFYGLDVYSLWESMHVVLEYLEKMDPELARTARRAYACFEPYDEDAQEYARATTLVPTSCEDEAVSILRALRGRASEFRDDGPDAYFNAEQNALVARNAELYYRTMVRGGPGSWNVRDNHMVETLNRLMSHHGRGAKAIVWEHNTHVGDARFTDMATSGMVNVGQLVRQEHERDGVVLVGFGTHRGTVIAGREWGATMERMRVPEAREGSYEHAMKLAGIEDSLFIFPAGESDETRELREPRGHRAIGVVYNPHTEHWGNYVPTILPGRYDAFIYIEKTEAVDALHMAVLVDGEVPETFPSGQ